MKKEGAKTETSVEQNVEVSKGAVKLALFRAFGMTPGFEIKVETLINVLNLTRNSHIESNFLLDNEKDHIILAVSEDSIRDRSELIKVLREKLSYLEEIERVSRTERDWNESLYFESTSLFKTFIESKHVKKSIESFRAGDVHEEAVDEFLETCNLDFIKSIVKELQEEEAQKDKVFEALKKD